MSYNIYELEVGQLLSDGSWGQFLLVGLSFLPTVGVLTWLVSRMACHGWVRDHLDQYITYVCAGWIFAILFYLFIYAGDSLLQKMSGNEGGLKKLPEKEEIETAARKQWGKILELSPQKSSSAQGFFGPLDFSEWIKAEEEGTGKSAITWSSITNEEGYKEKYVDLAQKQWKEVVNDDNKKVLLEQQLWLMRSSWGVVFVYVCLVWSRAYASIKEIPIAEELRKLSNR